MGVVDVLSCNGDDKFVSTAGCIVASLSADASTLRFAFSARDTFAFVDDAAAASSADGTDVSDVPDDVPDRGGASIVSGAVSQSSSPRRLGARDFSSSHEGRLGLVAGRVTRFLVR